MVVAISESGVLAAHCSKVNKETKLVKREFCFILNASNQWDGPTPIKGQLHPLTNSVQASPLTNLKATTAIARKVLPHVKVKKACFYNTNLFQCISLDIEDEYV